MVKCGKKKGANTMKLFSVRFNRLIAGVLLLTLLWGCVPVQTEKPAPTGPSHTPREMVRQTLPTEPVLEDPVEVLIGEMTLTEKVGQLFLIRPEALDPDQPQSQGETELTEAMVQTLGDYPPGGVVLFSQNLENPDQLLELTAQLQASSSVGLLLGVDEEGGLVARLANHPAFPLPTYESAGAVGASGDSGQAFAMGQTIGEYLRRYGFNLDFAPVADVNTNPDNPVIGSRAFSDDADQVTKMAAAMAEGLQAAGIIPTFKHFPGHGDTAQDSHTGLAVNEKTRQALEKCEWLPYRQLTNRECVMVGHIAVPEITGDDTPASLSEILVTQILRRELGFQGVVITDSLEMQAITDSYEGGEAAVRAIEAGCDLLLMPGDYRTAFQAVLTAVEEGRISQTRLDESLGRILNLKLAYGLLNLEESP